MEVVLNMTSPPRPGVVDRWCLSWHFSLKAEQGRSFTKLYVVIRVLLLETAVKAKMLTFVLPTEKRFVVSVWTFLKIARQPQRYQKFLLKQDYLSKVQLDKPLFCFKYEKDRF